MTPTPQPKALELADLVEKIHSFDVDFEAAAELRRQHAEITELRAALRALYLAAPTSLECNDFHHAHGDRHAYGEECKPREEYLRALSAARAALDRRTA